jgi:3-oxoacid CoA-transferase
MKSAFFVISRSFPSTSIIQRCSRRQLRLCSTLTWRLSAIRLSTKPKVAWFSNSPHGTNDKGRNPSSSNSTTKVVASIQDALNSVSSWSDISVAVGGFGVGGTPETLLNALAQDPNVSNLTISSLTGGIPGRGLGLLIEKGKVKHLISSYIGENPTLEDALFSGTLQVELTPQGTLAQRWQAAGAGMPAFYTPTGANTIYSQGGIPLQYAPDGSRTPIRVTEPKETRNFGGINYVLEPALSTHVALVKAHTADTKGNLVFRGTAQNSNPDAAMSATITIAEVEHIVEAGDIPPEQVHLPGIYVDAIVLTQVTEKPIERLRIKNNSIGNEKSTIVQGGRGRIMRRAAKEFQNGMYVNLGIGMPTMASNYIPEGIQIELQAENGLLGIGPYPPSVDEADADYINAGKETITAMAGASTFSSSNSFNMIRGGHVDLTILGGLQCSSSGDLANWIVPGKMVKGMGGAMDLVGAPKSRVVVTMDHTDKHGTPKILSQCTLPLTGHNVVDRIITDMGVFDVDKKGGTGLTLIEIAPGYTLQQVRDATGCDFQTVPEPIPLMDDE